MTFPTDDQPIDVGDGPAWQRFAGKRVDIYVQTDSQAVANLQGLSRQADRIVSTLEQMLEPGETRDTGRIDLYLAGSPEEAGSTAASDAEQPDALFLPVDITGIPAFPIEPVVRLLVSHWYGPAAAAAETMITGIAAVVEGRISNRPTVAEANATVRDALLAGQDVSIFPVDGRHPDQPDSDAAATSFVAYLIDVFGAPALGQFLAAFDPDRNDAAALLVFFQPLGALEEAWLRDVRHHAERSSAFRALFRQLMPLLRPHWLRVLELLVLMVLGVGLTLAVPLTIMYIVDHILPHAHGHYRDLALYIGLLLVLFIANAGINARRTYVQHWINQRVMMTLHQRLFQHLQRLSHNYYSRTTTSELMTMLTEDLREIQAAIAMVVGSGFYLGLLAFSTAVTVLVLDPLLGLMVLIIVPVFAAGYVALRTRWQREAHGFQRLQGEADHIAHENFSAHGEIKAFGLQDHAISQYQQRHHQMFGRQLRLVNLSGLFESMLHFASGLGYVIVFGVGGYQVISENGVTIGVLFAFAHLLPLFYEPIERLADLGHTVEGAAGAFDRIDEVLEEPVLIFDKPDAIELPPLSEGIRLEHVTFSYGSGRPVLRDLSLTIPAGADVAIIGPSGCGKSTLVNLLMRFWDPDEGRILLDGHDTRDVRIASLRSQMGMVFAETFSFNTSVRENIAIGYPDASDSEIERAARIAQFDQFVTALPARYNTVLGERGVRMSSGQRQRLAIARALLREPRILILDEATSALDPQTESEILETLATAGEGRTTVSIRHRLAAVATADIIFVLDQGRLVEQGRHAELVKAGGLYQRMYEEQMHYLHGGGVLRVGVEVQRLRLIPLFSKLDTEALEAVAEQFMLERYAAGELVVRQGDPGDKLYMISRGELEVLVTDNGSERLVNTLGRGDYFGEMALLSKEPRNATIKTVTPTQFYSLAAADFQALLERSPEVREAVSKTVEGRRAARRSG